MNTNNSEEKGHAFPWEGLSSLVTSASGFAWPIFATIVFLCLRQHIVNFLNRIDLFEGFGQKIQLRKSLDDLQIKADAATDSISTSVTNAVTPSDLEISENSETDVAANSGAETDLPAYTEFVAGEQMKGEARFDPVAKEILHLAKIKPTLALMQLSAEMEREFRKVFASQGEFNRRGRNITLQESARQATEKKWITSELEDSLIAFWKIRNQIVHGHSSIGQMSEEDILRAVDSGLKILEAIYLIPHTRHVVYHPGVDVYEDPEGKSLLIGVKAVTLTPKNPPTKK